MKNNLLLTVELVKVISLLKENDINAITYKGPLLAQYIYGNIGFRQFDDIDILIDRTEALKAKKIVTIDKYELYNPANLSDNDFLKYESEFKLINKITGVIIEINWNFKGNYFNLPENIDLLFENLKEYDINCFKMYSLSPLNLLLILSIHISKHNWMRISWLSDIYHLIQMEDIDWNKALILAKKLRIKRILLINLSLLNDLYDMEIPNIVKIHLSLDPFVWYCSNIIKHIIFNEDKIKLTDRFFLYFFIREKNIDGFKDCLNILTKVTYPDIEFIKLPKSLFPLYGIIHLFLLLRNNI
ncbi:MAG: hypothetical protein Kow0019_15810 [Methanobacteriaceae archaeon]